MRSTSNSLTMLHPAPAHTYDSRCRLAPRRQQTCQDSPPLVLARFFYSAPSSIDDPLSSGNLSTANVDARNSKGQYRPFSADDNHALETAWLGLASDEDQRAHREAKESRKASSTLSDGYTERLSTIVKHLAITHRNIHGPNYLLPDPTTLGRPALDGPELAVSACCPTLCRDVETEISQSFCALARGRKPDLGPHDVIGKVMEEFKRSRVPTSPGSAGPEIARSPSGSSRASSRRHADKAPAAQSPSGAQPSFPAVISSRTPAVDDGITGKPFIRVSSPDTTHASGSYSAQETTASVSPANSPPDPATDRSRQRPAATQFPAETARGPRSHAMSANVVVGVSRLHMVSLPALRMQPIYWSPMNDNAAVMRGTWFYRDTMLPVPPEVANQLESGYEELRPWTETWNDELKCAVEVGPLGEEKVSHRLWPDKLPGADRDVPDSLDLNAHLDPFCAARCFKGEVASEGILNRAPGAPNKDSDPSNVAPRMFANYHVIYRDASLAFLLKPSLKPSGYYGRRPVAKIIKGSTVGVPVVRGFDEAAWNKYYHNGPTTERKPDPTQPRPGVGVSGSPQRCLACELGKKDVRVSDLVLVIHGIGQKFAERVESFHFTHSINAFRRSVNLELNDPIVKEVLRDQDQTRIMVLPVNWRHNLSFEDGGPMAESDKASHARDEFALKDIEPPTIPAVRSMISDIMFDIPFYMSKHKPKMIHALVAEANRVYRRWCQNNPGFSENGRVHLIAHSLGSAMALDILSRQPSYVPRLDLALPSSISRFDFNTTNLFLVGSPASFFLMLERATLMPRRDRVKPGAVSSDTTSKNVAGEAGEFGCLAVDNIYNILAKEDPIAYLLNGTIDPAYAASLKTAYLPSASSSLFQTMGNALRSLVPGASPGPNVPAASQAKPAMGRLPSQLELEIHDFTREEIAEKKAYLLNDNGQLDYYLRSGGGPLEIQYLNMLGAHSSYWSHQDFIRMLCMETGRKPGRNNTLPAMRAAKSATQRLAPESQ